LVSSHGKKGFLERRMVGRKKRRNERKERKKKGLHKKRKKGQFG